MRMLYRDEHLAVVDKPAGLLVHRSAIDRHEIRFALQMARDLLGRRVYPVHRLDKPTSGALLLALDPDCARRLGESFAAGRIAKTYRAIVRGFTSEHAVINYPLAEALDPTTDRLADTGKGPQAALTEYRRLARVELPFPVRPYPSARYSLLELRPRTGRRHQLRRHLKHVFHPIVGDTTYGDGAHNRLFRDRLGCRRLLLAATALDFVHPYTGERLRVEAPPAEGFQRMIAELDWEGLADAA
jgi:tRNA pseudouridine65 synthase